MRTTRMLATVLIAASLAPGSDDAKETKVEYEVHSGYFEKNNSGLKGDQSFLALTDRKAFDSIFGVGFVMGKKPKTVPENAFNTKLVVATIKRGGDLWTYKVDKVTADKGTLTVHYDATGKDGGGAKFASPLILSVGKGKYKNVVFVEGGNEVGKAEIRDKK